MAQSDGGQQDFEQIANTGRTSVVMEFLAYLRHSKKWWMLPILIVMFCLGILVLLSSTPVAPFIYTLF
jgi:Family of unknown function (DUF5989)